jgi:hypothetical protein
MGGSYSTNGREEERIYVNGGKDSGKEKEELIYD